MSNQIPNTVDSNTVGSDLHQPLARLFPFDNVLAQLHAGKI